MHYNMPQPGFTKQELEAFKWSKQRKNEHRPKKYKRRSYSPVSSSVTDSSDSDIPKDPFNPLLLSTSKGHNRRRKDSKRHSPKSNSRYRTNSPKKWDHELFYINAESDSDDSRKRVRSNIDFDTRVGAWRSRAGGAYLSPERPLSKDERDKMYPKYESRKKSSSPYRKKHRSYSPSPSRPSPTYEL